ncbi:hypothetical protein SPRG_08074 [Saprolegnia parasitica CBS 223.65]|uniref:Myosin motor domain-containing protein n=1 Tax=Saprolegnia parasitica (strain CBS 223.65) TaxID=695850 RepID=A0A067C7Q1_SAPPC|nr:hypothetical protein SPRG_08074 [Saprolegnia parasitica CBS 223.65]KDO26784.1 hypothetical protein SPRG_08074 [Saprolegnia parasitica CBS 223.65]|eukprot:XP_012202432.1 hypothetical protein SPRG_08074 [Saprolegnia parasitica CBS 223.65]
MEERFRVDSSASSESAEQTMYMERPEQWVWCPDDALVCVPGVIVAQGAEANTLIVHTEDGEERQLDIDEALPVCMDLSLRVSDVAELFLQRPETPPDHADAISARLLGNLTGRNETQAQALEHALLYTLRTRYRDEQIYTECGASVLLSMNPKRPVPLYTPDRIRAYRHRQTLHELPPHLFGLAEDAMRALHESGDDQAIVLLGESGSGKSEAAKLVLQYLCHHEQSRGSIRTKSRSNASEGSASASSSSSSISVHIPVEEQILHAVAVLEAFGHVQLASNANASRVVKLTSVDYDSHGRLLAGSVSTYGLEKARVVQTKERNFHIFHYLLAEASVNPTLSDILDLQDTVLAATSPFTFAAGDIRPSDAIKYQDVVSSLAALRVPSHHVQNMMKVLAVILHLGNVVFVPSTPHDTSENASCVVLESSSPSLIRAASLLEVEASVLDHYFRTRKMVTSNHQSSLKIVSVSQAARARDTFCRNLYEALFNAVVFRMNASLRSKVERYEKSNIMVENRGIHVLDGFGFEMVADPSSSSSSSSSPSSLIDDTMLLVHVQGLETLHAHYWAEKARSFYLSRVFESPASTSPLDPTKYVRLYEGTPAGIYVVLNEHMASKAKQAHDAHFVNKLLVANENIGNPSLQPVLPSSTNKKNYKLQFLVHHSAGSIIYEADDMARRNNKSVSSTAAAILKSSRNSFVKGLVDRYGNSPTHAAAASASAGHVRIAVNFNAIKANQPDTNSVATDLMQQATALFDGLSSMGQHFVVCVNPAQSAAIEVDARYVLRQLRSFQVLALMHASQRNLSVQMTPPHFFARYRHLCGHRNTLESLVRSLTAIGVLEDLTWRIDNNQVWLTLHQRKKLEKVREVCLNANATMLQRNLQRGVYRKLCLRRRSGLLSLRDAMAARDRHGIQQSLAFAKTWVEATAQVRILVAATAMLHQIEEESYLVSLLEDALRMDVKIVLQFALHTVATLSPSWKPEMLKTAHARLRHKTAMDNAMTALRQAMLSSTADPSRLMALLSEQEGRGSDERQLATMVMIRALETKKVKDAVLPAKGSSATAAEWNQCIARAIEFGLGDDLLDMMAASWDAWACLREQGSRGDVTAVEAVLEKAVAKESVTTIDACMGILKEAGCPPSPLLDAAAQLLEKVILKPSLERSQAIELIDFAIEAGHLKLLAAALKRCKAVGMASWDANVKRATQAHAALATTASAPNDDDAWRRLVAKDFDGVRASPDSPAHAIVSALDARAAAIAALHDLPAETQLERAAQLGVLPQFASVAKDFFQRLDAARNVEALLHWTTFLAFRLDHGHEVRQDMLTLLASQTQLVTSLGANNAHAALDAAASITKRLQRALTNRSKLEKLLKAPVNARALAKGIDEASDAGVDAALLSAAHDVLRKLSVAAADETIDETPSSSIVDASHGIAPLEMALYPGLRVRRDENPPPFVWEYRVLDQPVLSGVPAHHSVYIHRCILGYMRDRVMSFREMLAQSILQVGLAHQYLVDEIFAQLVKQLSNNPRRESVRRGWDLLGLCLTCFRPSSSLHPYLVAFLSKDNVSSTTSRRRLETTTTDSDDDHDVDDEPSEVHDNETPLDQRLALLKARGVAQYCLARLEGDSAAEGFLPSLGELQAFELRSPFVASIELLDGTLLTTNFPVSPELSVMNVVQVCAHFCT